MRTLHLHYASLQFWKKKTDNLFIYDVIFNLESPLLYLQTKLTKYAPSQKKKKLVALVRERTIPTERPPPVGEVSANFRG